MKIGILTQALHGNYGGILQNFALQKALLKMGYEPITIDRHIPRTEGFIKKAAKRILQVVKPRFDSSLLTVKQKADICRLQKSFIDQYIIKTEPIYTQNDFDKYVSNNIMDIYIVGSDQCWRPCYSANILNYYLNFVKTGAKRIAYAASFGVDKWEYSKTETYEIINYIKRFDAISVREKSGLSLCKEKLGVKANWVLDPTMLLGKEGFMEFITTRKKDYILSYILEESVDSIRIIENVAKKIEIKNILSNLSPATFHREDSILSHQNISIEQWLSNIYNAAFVITDSFHGAVFCILFNIPFIVKLNEVRGNTRIESLLADFELEDCVCNDVSNIKLPVFNWEKVNNHLSYRQKESWDFLEKALS